MIGAMPTFGLILATGFLGSYMAKTQGLAVWTRLNQKMSAGQLPGKELTDGAIILVAGTLLVTPGVLTDFIGLMGLIPVTRSIFRKMVESFIKRRTTLNMGFGTFGASQGFSHYTQTSETSVPDPSPESIIELSGKGRSRPSRDEE